MRKISIYFLALTLTVSVFLPNTLFAEKKSQSDQDVAKDIGLPNPVPQPCVVVTAVLDEGATDATTDGQVSKVQRYLAEFGDISKSDVTGRFDTKTKEAVKKIQKRKNIEAVGTVGPQTRKILSRDCISGTVSTTTTLSKHPKGVTYAEAEAPSFWSWLATTFSPTNIVAQVLSAVGAGAGTGQTVDSFTIVNADTDQDIAQLINGTTIDLARLPTRNINIRANTTPKIINNKIRFGYTSTSNYANDATAPYTIGGDDGATNYYAWKLTTGNKSIKATPFNRNKSSGTTLSVNFTVIDSDTTATDTISPTISITSPATNTNVSAPVSISIQATDNIGVSKVELYKDGILFDSKTISPFTFNWTPPTPVSANITTTFTAKAYDAAGNTTTSAPVSYITVFTAAAPTVTLTALPTSVTAGNTSTITWSSVNATSCTATGAWSGTKAVSGALAVTPTATSTYSLACTGSGGTTNASVTIGFTPLPLPTVTLTASPSTIISGSSATLSWSSTNTVTCTASGAWTGTKAVSGTSAVTPTANSTYSISCTGVGGTKVASVTITVTPLGTIPTPTTITSCAATTGQVSIAWTEASRGSAGYSVDVDDNTIWTDGYWSKSIATGVLSAIAPATFVNTASSSALILQSGHSYAVRVNYKATGESSPTATFTAPDCSTPPPPAAPVTVSIKNMISFNELYIEGTDANDSISITQSGSAINVYANGTSQAFIGPFGDIVIKGDGGSNTLSVDGTVTGRVLVYGTGSSDTIVTSGSAKITAVTIGGGTASITGNGNTSYWVGSEDAVHATSAEIAAGRVHTVTSFLNYGSLTLNGPTDIADPTDTSWDTIRVTNRSLWGQGPRPEDINQGNLADCYYLATLAGAASANPTAFEENAVDLGDGTYAVRYGTSYVREDADLDFLYNHPGPSGNVWGLVFEKAYAFYRTRANTYASIAYGNSSAVMSHLGIANSYYYPITNATAATLYSNNMAEVAAHKLQTSATPVSGTIFAGNHAYTVIGTSGSQDFIIRNPWGTDGPGGDSVNDGYITVPVSTIMSNMNIYFWQR